MSEERKVDHILGTISEGIELYDGTKLNVKPATWEQRHHLEALLEVVGSFLGRLSGGSTEDGGKKALRRELQARLGHAEADIMNAEPESTEMAEAVAKKEMLAAHIKALDAASGPDFAGGFQRLVSQDTVPFLMENADKVVGPVRALAGYQSTDEEFNALPIADVVLMLVTVLVVNVDFFVQRLKPVTEALANIKSALLLKKSGTRAAVTSPPPVGNS